jgi:hypothetical protein
MLLIMKRRTSKIENIKALARAPSSIGINEKERKILEL